MVGQRTYTWGTGRRKTAVARVRICDGEGVMQINKKDWKEYFTTPAQRIAARPRRSSRPSARAAS